jgi:peptide chain release factor 1
MVRVDGGRSQHQNRQAALALLRARLWEEQRQAAAAQREAERRAQTGSGERGDKRRTIRCQDGVVVDHVLGQRWPLRQYLRGEW